MQWLVSTGEENEALAALFREAKRAKEEMVEEIGALNRERERMQLERQEAWAQIDAHASDRDKQSDLNRSQRSLLQQETEARLAAEDALRHAQAEHNKSLQQNKALKANVTQLRQKFKSMKGAEGNDYFAF